MTVMWAGPLATRLLADRGAEVVKVEPACRMDGTRGTAMFDAL
ncbi:MAG: CoA transferase, partial [Actinobacteria bacterium]|nr:CoA transferase [Actinomycetota bacterium]